MNSRSKILIGFTLVCKLTMKTTLGLKSCRYFLKTFLKAFRWIITFGETFILVGVFWTVVSGISFEAFILYEENKL